MYAAGRTCFGWEGHMGKRLNGWSLAGFLTVSVLGTLAHFCYEWSGRKLLVGAFCAPVMP